MHIRSFKRVLLILFAAGSAGLTGCQEQRGPAPRPAPVAVTAVPLAYESVPVVLQAPGSIQPRNRISLSSQINGSVREVRVRAGDEVSKGQVLATLDARDAESQKGAAQAATEEANAALAEARQSLQASEKMLAAARASAELAESTLARYQKLFDARSVSPQELDEARTRRNASTADVAAREAMAAAARERIRQVEARVVQAKAQLGRADVVLGWTVVSAPASGRVAQRLADPGSAIFPGSPLLVIETTRDLEILASIPATQAGLLKRGLEVRVGITTDSPSTLQGSVSEIIPSSDPSTHTVQFKVALPRGFSSPPGEFVKVDVPAGSRQALLVPRQAVRETGQLTGVFVVDPTSFARFRLVKTAPYDAGRVELLSGVDRGERVIVRPGPEILDGTPVEVRP
jgi:multidrug efflux pump subunit AcrA (membrane-fusion protein)